MIERGGSIFLRPPGLLKSSPSKGRKIFENKIRAWGVKRGEFE